MTLKVTRNVAKYPLHFVTYAPAKFEVAMSNGYKKINYLNFGHTKRCLVHVTYTPAKIEVACPSGLVPLPCKV